MADITDKRVERMYEKGNTKGLIKALLEPDKAVRSSAVEALSVQLKFSHIAKPELVQAAKDALVTAVADPETAGEALEALAQAGDERVKNLALGMLGPAHPYRAIAAGVVEKMPDVRAAQPLLLLLKDEDMMVRRSAARALGALRDPCAADALFDAFLNDPDSGVQNRARTSLIALRDKRLLEPVMEKALRDIAEIYSRGKIVATVGGVSASIDEGKIQRAGEDLNALGGFEAMKIAYARFCTVREWPKAVEQDLFKLWAGIGDWGKQA
jgi:HEAT repeat protein